LLKYGIVGSRRRKDRKNIEKAVNCLPQGSTVVSGGCRGVDTWAEQAAKKKGLEVQIFKPDFTGCRSYWDRVNAYYSRNKRIAELSDIIIAFVSDDRKGGTENTIKHARKLGKEIIIK